MKKEVLHEKIFAIKYLLDSGDLQTDDLPPGIEQDLEQVKTGKDGMIDPSTVSKALLSLIESTLEN